MPSCRAAHDRSNDETRGGLCGGRGLVRRLAEQLGVTPSAERREEKVGRRAALDYGGPDGAHCRAGARGPRVVGDGDPGGIRWGEREIKMRRKKKKIRGKYMRLTCGTPFQLSILSTQARHISPTGGPNLSVSLFSRPNLSISALLYRLGTILVVFCALAQIWY